MKINTINVDKYLNIRYYSCAPWLLLGRVWHSSSEVMVVTWSGEKSVTAGTMRTLEYWLVIPWYRPPRSLRCQSYPQWTASTPSPGRAPPPGPRSTEAGLRGRGRSAPPARGRPWCRYRTGAAPRGCWPRPSWRRPRTRSRHTAAPRWPRARARSARSWSEGSWSRSRRSLGSPGRRCGQRGCPACCSAQPASSPRIIDIAYRFLDTRNRYLDLHCRYLYLVTWGRRSCVRPLPGFMLCQPHRSNSKAQSLGSVAARSGSSEHSPGYQQLHNISVCTRASNEGPQKGS